ncbi:MAG: acyl-CoA thioesterase [bacterium]|nr:acyl-CoA thioesterase [bacterium]
MSLEPKTAKESAINDYPYILFETDINPRGTAFGGRVMEVADKVAAIVSRRHSRVDCVTLQVDSLKFIGPAVKGEVLVYKAAVNRVWRTSMEIGVKVYAESPRTGERRHVVSAYFTFVGIGDDSRPITLPQAIPETDEEKRRYEKADLRRQRRLKEDREDSENKKITP